LFHEAEACFRLNVNTGFRACAKTCTICYHICLLVTYFFNIHLQMSLPVLMSCQTTGSDLILLLFPFYLTLQKHVQCDANGLPGTMHAAYGVTGSLLDPAGGND
jgi:hypothetical protein